MHKAVEGLLRALYIHVVDRLAKGPPMPAATCLKVIVAAVVLLVTQSLAAVVTAGTATAASLYGSGDGYCGRAEAGGYPLGPSMVTAGGRVFACGPVPVLGDDSGPAIPKFWPTTDEGGFQCTELAVRYLYLATDGRVYVNIGDDSAYWEGDGKDFAGSVGPHFGFGPIGSHINGQASAQLPQVGDILSEMVGPGETAGQARPTARKYGDVGVVYSVSAATIELMVENNNRSGLNTITISDARHWSINGPRSGFYYTSFKWFSPASQIPAVTMPVSPYAYAIYGTGSEEEFAQPSVASAKLHLLPDGNRVYIACQGAGESVGGSAVWDRLTNGGWVPDFFVDTSNIGTFTYPIPTCIKPGYWDYRVKGAAPREERRGPAARDAGVGSVAGGTVVGVVCETQGSSVGGSDVWDYLLGHGYLPNAYLGAPVAGPNPSALPVCPDVNPSGKQQAAPKGTTGPAPGPTAEVAGAPPGYGSPEEPVAGVYTELLVDEDIAGSCRYVAPDQQAACQLGAGLAGRVSSTGHIRITAEVTDGDRALVAFTGSLCQTGSPCMSNADPRLGLPSSLSGFDRDYAAAVANNGNSWGAAPCLEVAGKWYVNAGL